MNRSGLISAAILLLTACNPSAFSRENNNTETMEQFLAVRKIRLEEIIACLNSEACPEESDMDTEIEDLGFQQLRIEGDTFIFIVDGMIDNSYGVFYDVDGIVPETILNATTWHQKIEDHWYEFSTT